MRGTARTIEISLVLLVLAIALGAMVLPTVTIGLDRPESYNEGWNVYHAARVAAGEDLYAGDPHRFVNYPFLSFFLIAGLKPLFGNLLVIGRVLNLLAFAATALGGALIVRQFGGRAISMLFAAAAIIGFQRIQAAAWIATDEPQMLAQACMVAALLCHVSGRRTFLRLGATAVFLATGGFIKQTLLAIPFAITLDILWNERRHFLAWCFCLGGAALAYLALTYALAHGDFLSEILAPRVFRWEHVVYHARKFLIALKFPLLAAIVYLVMPLPRDRAVLLRSFAAMAIPGDALLSGFDGVSENIFLEAAVFLGITAGLALSDWSGRLNRGRAAQILTVALLPALIGAPLLSRLPASLAPLFSWRETIAAEDSRAAAFRAAAAALRRMPGPAICEDLLLCYDAGKPLLLDPFNTEAMILSHRLSEAALTGDLAAHRFAIIALPGLIHPYPEQPDRINPYLLNQGRFTRGTLDAIERFYRPTPLVGGFVLYLPR